MKKLLFNLVILSLPFFSNAQLNMNQLGHLDLVALHNNSEGNDIWGYVDGSGNEYAIVGLNDGTSVVDVTDPTNPTEVFYEAGMNSIWRDIKTWGNYAYVTTEAQNGLLIIDLSTLPANPNLTTTYYFGPNDGQWQSAHNLYIDENGYCYIFGANRGNGGTIILDLNTDPMNPVEVGTQDLYYTHDGVVRGDTLYEAHINDGFFTMWDISNKATPIQLGQSNTPGFFSHNIWFSDDGNYVYTTDEITNGFIGEYNISDPNNIIETDQIQSSPGMNVIPHNAHFIDDYIVTSYYRDGVVIHDVSDKGNMVEVGNYDTAPTLDGDGFNGCWGVYPWLPSGNIIASDIENGLHVLGVTYQRGCYLEGTVTELGSGTVINGASISIQSTSISDQSNVTGFYATGIATAGTYDVIYSHPSYYSDTIFGVFMANGATNVQNVQLEAITPEDVDVSVSEGMLTVQIPNVEVTLSNDNFSFDGTTDNSGVLTFTGVIPGNYLLTVGKWGYNTYCQEVSVDNNNTTLSVNLLTGYYDDFALDFNWTVSGSAPDGVWERGEPNGTVAGSGIQAAPEEDAQSDCGTQAYVTGNASVSNVGADDVDISDVVLTSPIMDLSSYSYPEMHCKIWWQNFGGQGNPNDSLRIYVNNGTDKILAHLMLPSDTSQSWQDVTIRIPEHVAITNSMNISFETADYQDLGGHLVEAGVDLFRIMEAPDASVSEIDLQFQVYPNPNNGKFFINHNLMSKTEYQIIDISGRIIDAGILNQNETEFQILKSGIYLVNLQTENKVKTKKIIIQ